MVRFGYAVTVGSLFACLLFACGDKGAKPSPGSTGGAAGTTDIGGTTGAGGTIDNGDLDGGFSEAGVAAGGAGGSTTVTVSYSKTIAPMMAASCAISGCHSGSNPSLGISLDTYAGVKANATQANTAIKNGDMPIAPGADLTAVDKQNFQNWVTAGALNN